MRDADDDPAEPTLGVEPVASETSSMPELEPSHLEDDVAHALSDLGGRAVNLAEPSSASTTRAVQ
jgi:hypothetical protein